MSQYAQDMLKDNRAERFFVPDDHVDQVRESIRNHIDREQKSAERFRRMGDHARAAKHQEKVRVWQRNLDRVAPLGRTYEELERAVTRSAKGVIGRAAGATGGLSAGAVFVIDGGIVLYESSNGGLTPRETQRKLLETGVKGTVTGGAVGIVVVAGANPIGIVVLVAGGASYFVADYALSRVGDHYASTPLTAEQILALKGDLRATPIEWLPR